MRMKIIKKVCKVHKVHKVYKVHKEKTWTDFQLYRLSTLRTDRGFVALILVISLMFTMLLGSLGAFAAALGYSDSVARREYRLEAAQNARSCVSAALLAFAHDYFYAANDQSVPDFSCTIVSASRVGPDISVVATSTVNGVTASVSAAAADNGRSIDLVSEANI